MHSIIYILPEIFLSLLIMFLLMLGVFIKKSFNLVYLLAILGLIFSIALVLNQPDEIIKIFNESYIIDKLSIFMKVLTLLFCLFVLLSTKDYVKSNNIDKIEYPIIVLAATLGMILMISSYDLIVFYLGLELQSLSLYILAAFKRNNEKSTEAGLKYFVLSALASGLLLYGCSLIYGFTGSTNFEIISKNLNETNTGAVFGIVFIMVGLAFKVSAAPFHMWTPDVYEGSPTSVTSFFALVPKIAAIAVFIRFMYVPFINVINQWQTIIIFFINCINDIRCCSSHRTKQYKKIDGLQHHWSYGLCFSWFSHRNEYWYPEHSNLFDNIFNHESWGIWVYFYDEERKRFL